MSDFIPVNALSDVPPGRGTGVTAGSEPAAEPAIGSDVRASRHDEKVVATQVFVRLVGAP